jgi:hypothetical protein
MLGIFACIGVWIISFIIPFVFKPVQAALSPYACEAGSTLTSESHTCEGENGGTATCSNMICVSPDGQTTQAWKLLIFSGGTFCGMMLFILLMVVLMMRNQMNAGPPAGAFGPTITVGGTGMDSPVQVITPNMANRPINIQIQDMNVPLDEQIAKLDKLRENGTLTWEQYQQAVEGVRKAYGDL